VSGPERCLSRGELPGAVQRRSTLEPERAPLSPASIAFVGGMLLLYSLAAA